VAYDVLAPRVCFGERAGGCADSLVDAFLPIREMTNPGAALDRSPESGGVARDPDPLQ